MLGIALKKRNHIIEVKFMTTKKKRQTSPAGRRMATVALSLCLLAGVTLFGMYTVGKTEEQQRRLEQEVADAEKAAQARQQEVAAKAAREQKAAKAERQAASGSASRAGRRLRDSRDRQRRAGGRIRGNQCGRAGDH